MHGHEVDEPLFAGVVFHSLSKPFSVLYTPSIWWITTLCYFAVNFSFYEVYGVPGDVPHGRIDALEVEALLDGEGSGDGVLVARAIVSMITSNSYGTILS